jgi:hypothetical protein
MYAGLERAVLEDEAARASVAAARVRAAAQLDGERDRIERQGADCLKTWDCAACAPCSRARSGASRKPPSPLLMGRWGTPPCRVAPVR